jgi:hypothetical protein
MDSSRLFKNDTNDSIKFILKCRDDLLLFLSMCTIIHIEKYLKLTIFSCLYMLAKLMKSIYYTSIINIYSQFRIYKAVAPMLNPFQSQF